MFQIIAIITDPAPEQAQADWLGTDFGMNRNKSDWFGMNFNPKLLPGREHK